jgi:uncharacterized protein (TIGR02444 family)
MANSPRVYHYYSISDAWAIESLRAVMTEAASEPPDEEALWHFSLEFYSRPGVSEALIALQDRASRDVNLMLFALWLGVSGRGRVTNEELESADRIVRPISAEIVEPLRALRRKLRSDPDTDVQRLREGVKALELAAERIVQRRLAHIAGSPVSDADPASRVAAAYANLALYLGSAMAGSPEAATIGKALEAFLGG